MYKIKIGYQTGNSFGRESTESILEIDMMNLEVAKQNLKRIQEHYKMYLELHAFSMRRRKDSEIFDEYKTHDWFREDHPEHMLILKTDDGCDYPESTFWTGYFESLEYIEIVLAETEGMRIDF
jgi:hypothetical protein